MKKVIITLLMTGFAMHLQAQVPQKKSVAIIHKLTATWCPPCGGWGWQTAEELIDENEGKALFISLYVGSNSNNNELFKNPISEALAPNFTTTSGLPNFGVNGTGLTSEYLTDKHTDIAGLKAACLKATNDFSQTTPVASPACILSFEGNSLIADTKVKFWSAAQGDYYLAAYLIEDSAVNTQRTPDSIWTQAQHRKVLRGSMSGKPFGELIAAGTINTGQVYDKRFRFTITDTTWNKNKLQVYTVLWRKEYNDYRYVNASSSDDAPPQPTTLDDVHSLQEIVLFPNPSSHAVTLSITSSTPQPIGIFLTDMMGRTVYQVSGYKTTTGNNHITLPLSNITNGTYIVSVLTKDGPVTRRLSVLR